MHSVYALLTFRIRSSSCFFFFNDTATTEIYTLSLHDALPICSGRCGRRAREGVPQHPDAARARHRSGRLPRPGPLRSEEHTSELQSRLHLVCRLLLEKKKNIVAAVSTVTQYATEPSMTLTCQR